MYPWTDRTGRLSWLKAVSFAALWLPGLWFSAALAMGDLGPRPLSLATHEIGLWAIRLLFLSLAITPLRQLFGLPVLIQLRRMIGVAAFAYALAHFGLYAADQAFDWGQVALEIVRRTYLTIGFVGLLGLAALAATSTDKMMRRLGGRRWQNLHRLTYPLAVIATIHMFMQAKLTLTEPMVMAGVLAWLLGYRLLAWRLGTRAGLGPAWTAALSLAAGVGTAVGECGYILVKFNPPIAPVLATIFGPDGLTRPAGVVLGLGAVVTLATIVRWARSARQSGPGGPLSSITLPSGSSR